MALSDLARTAAGTRSTSGAQPMNPSATPAAPASRGLAVPRRFTTPGVHPYNEVTWELRTSAITNERGEIVFQQTDVEIPKPWSQTATNVVVSKYFRGALGSPTRERSVKSLIDRVANTISDWGIKDGYFAGADDAETFRAELTHILLTQKASFNSPVWFNVGIEKTPQCSACQPYHALVNTVQGPMPIGEIVTKNLVGLPVYDGNGLTQVVAVKHNGRKPVYRITLNDGFSIEATPDHLVCAHTARRTRQVEWRRVDELKPGMVMRVYPHAAAEAVAVPAPAMAVAEAALAGWLQADGFVGQYAEGTNRSLTLEFMTVDDQEHEWVMRHLDTALPGHHHNVTDVPTKDTSLRCRRIRLYGKSLRPFVERYNLRERGTRLRVPERLWTAPREAVSAYLKSVFQSDGYVAGQGSSARVAFSVISDGWAKDVQQLLTRLGIYTRRRTKIERREDRHDLHEVDAAIRSERDRFQRHVGFVSERKNARLRQSLTLEGKTCPDVRYSEIVAIEPVGEMDVYDIQTGSGQYLTNSVLVHNCFILSVKDTMESILDWYKTEGMIFKYGSGSGINLSGIRSSQEALAGGGTASGPVSFMRAADASAGVIKSGGKTRRAAKMVVLNADHPDVKKFILCKWHEEKKAWTLVDAGFDNSIDGEAYGSVFFQNANNSVRATDAFMQAVVEDKDWTLKGVVGGAPVETVKARELMRLIAEATWHCGDPGMQFDTTINDWHTCPNTGRINASNPCFTGDMRVSTNRGLIPFKELYERAHLGESFRVFTHDATNPDRPSETISLTKPTQVMMTGVNPVLTLVFSGGIEITCTKHHRFFTRNRGMVAAEDLTPDDQVLVTNQPLEFDASLAIDLDHAAIFASGWGGRDTRPFEDVRLPSVWTSPLAEYVGYLVGDGCVREASGPGQMSTAAVVFGAPVEVEELAPRFRTLFNEMGVDTVQEVALPNGTVQLRVNRTPVVRFLKQLGVSAEKAPAKVVPHAIFRSPKQIVAGFLRGLFTADGCVYDGTKSRYVGLGSVSQELLAGVQQLLATFGITSRIYATRKPREAFAYTKRDGSRVTYRGHQLYDLRIAGPGISAFKEQVGFLTSDKQAKLDRLLAEHAFYRSNDTVRLVKRTDAGREPTYNLTEPKNHSYIVESLIVSNCSEYMSLDDSACNLASLNLLRFTDEDGTFRVDDFRHAVRIMTLAQDIVVDNSSYPTPKITENAKAYRQLGLGYANLGALLMSLGVPYDSDAGRAYAAALTALTCGEAYRMSTLIAQQKGPYTGYAANREPQLKVIRKHRDALATVDDRLVPEPIYRAAAEAWDDALRIGTESGVRNSQVTVLAPTGTIGFMMDCDTTGIEPDIALIKYKKLVGGGLLKIVNQTVPRALRRLGYTEPQSDEICRYLDEQETIEGAPHVKPEHLPVFDCAFKAVKGTRSIHYLGHVRMMGAVQPFISGAISKTVNVPADATVEEIEEAYIQSWKLGVKAVAIYRDGSKRVQPLSTGGKTEKAAETEAPAVREKIVYKPVRHYLPDERQALTHKFSIAGHDGYVTVGLYEDGAPGEIFIVMSKEGTVISGLLDAFATAISLALQFGVPLEALVKKYSHMRFEPAGITSNPQIRFASSILDYVFRWMALKFLPPEKQPAAEAPSLTAPTTGPKPSSQTVSVADGQERQAFQGQLDAPPCPDCGLIMIRSGNCYKCFNCGSTSGCS